MNDGIRDQLDKASRIGGDSEAPTEAAATVVVCRDGTDGPEVLLMHRNSKIAFGGAWVFPGGKVDPEDEAAASRVGSGGDIDHDSDGDGDEQEIEAARVAAIREAKEEAGLDLSTATLSVWSHWMPPASAPRRFSTWFFVAAATDQEIVIDNGEITDHAWMAPAIALERHSQREIELAPPTWVTLHDVGSFATVAELLATAASAPTPRFSTRIGRLGDNPVAMWTPDSGWESGDTASEGPRHRLIMRRTGWELERSPT